MMDKQKKIILAVGVAAIAALLVLAAVLLTGAPNEAAPGAAPVPVAPAPAGNTAANLTAAVPGAPEANLSGLEAMQLNPPADYINQLKAIIAGSPDPYVRGNAVLVLAQLAIRKNETGNVTDYLKGIATGEESEEVRTSAFVSLDLIRGEYPPAQRGSLQLSLTGAIKKGANVTLNARVSTTATPPEPAIVGINSLPTGIKPLSAKAAVKFPLAAGQTKEVRFSLLLEESGDYYIPVTFMMSFDAVDYEKITKKVHVRVTETGGEILQ